LIFLKKYKNVLQKEKEEKQNFSSSSAKILTFPSEQETNIVT